MFGLLDDMEDPRAAGQMAMALGLLEAGGPSAQPIGLGQAFARAYGQSQRAMQGAQDRRQDNRLADVRMRLLQGQLAEQDATLAEKKRISDFYGSLGRFSAPPESQALAAGAAQGDIGPTVTNAARIPDMPPATFDSNAMYRAMLQSGSPTLAQAGLQGMTKERPKVKEWQKVNVGGQVLYAPYFEDGTVGKPVPYEVAEKLEFRDMGGTQGAFNPFTGTQVTSAKKTLSPDAAASNSLGWANFGLSKQRLALDRANQNQPQFSAELGGFVTKPTAGAPQGSFTPLSGYTKPEKPLTEAQAKDNLFGTRANEANKIISGLETQKDSVTRPGVIKSTAEQTGRILGLGTDSLGGALADTFGTLTNWTQSSDQQRVEQARRDFINAVLRKESGAVIGTQEFANAEKQYFPQAGDSDAVIKQKQKNRELAIQGVLSGVPEGQRVKSPSVPTTTGTRGGASGDWVGTGMPSDISNLLKKYGDR